MGANMIFEVKGAIFDCDGTILDSMPIWQNSSFVFLKKLGINGKPDLPERLFTATLQSGAELLKSEYSLDLSIDEIKKGIMDVVEDFYRNEVTVKNGVFEILEKFIDRKIPCVVVSSGERKLIDIAFDRLHLGKYFKKILCGKKTDPEIFHEACRALSLTPENILVFEDALYAIKISRNLGFKTCGIYDEASKCDWEEIKETAHVHGKFWHDIMTVLQD